MPAPHAASSGSPVTSTLGTNMTSTDFLKKCHYVRRAFRSAIIRSFATMAVSTVIVISAIEVFPLNRMLFQSVNLVATIICLLWIIPARKAQTLFSCSKCRIPLYGLGGSHANYILSTGFCSKCGNQILDDLPSTQQQAQQDGSPNDAQRGSFRGVQA